MTYAAKIAHLAHLIRLQDRYEYGTRQYEAVGRWLDGAQDRYGLSFGDPEVWEDVMALAYPEHYGHLEVRA